MKKTLSVLLTLVCLAAIAWGSYAFYQRFLCPMRIGVMTMQGDGEWLAYKDAAAGTPYSVHRIKKEDMATATLENFDILFLRGMGWQPSDEEIANVKKAQARGTAVYVAAATRESTQNMTNIPEELRSKISEYLNEGGTENVRAMFKLLASELKGHRVAVPEVVKKPKRGYYHLSDKLFESLDEFEQHLDELYPHLSEDAPRIAMSGAFLSAGDSREQDSIRQLTKKLADRGMRVYNIMGFGGLQMLEDCKPDAAIYYPMGRMAGKDEAVKLFDRLNIPCFDAINIMENLDDWQKEPTAMSGGYLSQAVVMPELDGIIEPTAIAAMQTTEEGLTLRLPIDSRIDMLARRIDNWIQLKRKPNSEKRVAIVYYKAPGHSALTASGMETVDSLYNTLCRMKNEGYNLGENFPASSAELNDLIQQQGRTIGQWAIGAMEEFVEAGHPEFVPAEDYVKWLESDLPEENRKALVALWGDPPGKQMAMQKDDKPHLLVTRVLLGNIVLMPQPSAAIISSDIEATDEQRADESTAIHGTDSAPPHFYLGAYLWVRHGFQADAIMHFGTHGSLEFTRGKSAVLSDQCWPTILIGDLPHIYPYIINNIGEAMVAKRRSSAVIVTHLTPPFTKSELYGDMDLLDTKLHDYETVEGDALKDEILKTITQIIRNNDLAKEIGFDENLPEDDDYRLPVEKLEVLHEHLHELERADITDGLHVIGRAWTEQQIQDTVNAMLGDMGLEYIDDVRDSGKLNIPEDIANDKMETLKWLIIEILAGNITKEMIATVEKPKEESDTEASGGTPEEKTVPVEAVSEESEIKADAEATDDISEENTDPKEESKPEVKSESETPEDTLKEDVSADENSTEVKTENPPTEVAETLESDKTTEEKPELSEDQKRTMPEGMRERMRQRAAEGGGMMGGRPGGGEMSEEMRERMRQRAAEGGGMMGGRPGGGEMSEEMRERMRQRAAEGDGMMGGGSRNGTPGEGRPGGRGGMGGARGGGGMAGMMGMGGSSLEPDKTVPEDKPLALFEAISKHAENLKQSIPNELDAMMTGLAGGYVKPSSGGDAIINPDSVPTGRNMASVNIEQTPTQEAYRVAEKLTDDIINSYRDENSGAYPRRIACTFWGGEYIRTRGVVLAQGLYLMGLKPRRDSRGVVYDVEIIPSEELGRPRIDVVVQTSGQFRDAAGSRIELLDKAVIMVSELPDEKYPNFVKLNTNDTELILKKQGLSAAQAREYATARIFGSPTGSYGTGIMGAVSRNETDESGRVAEQYIRNMGGMYRNGKVWGVPVEGLFEAQLQGTDLMIQSRSSNTWGPLSLDHVYEFNTLALAVREKTGKDPGIWFSDLRNGSRPRAQTAAAAIREEARTTMWNPKYIEGLQREGASAAAAIVEPVRNMQGWNFIQPDAIDEYLWDETYRVYIEDKHNLDMKAYFEEKSPYALQDLTAVMLETIRKGMWEPSEDVTQELVDLHIEMVEKHGAGCSGDTCGNANLHAFLGQHASGRVPIEAYQAAMAQALQSRRPAAAGAPEVEGMKLEETTITLTSEKGEKASAPFFLSMMVLILGGFLILGFAAFRK